MILQETEFLANTAKVLLPAVTAAIAIYNWRAARFRSKLKDDLDILHRYQEEFCDSDGSTNISDDICYKHLRARIQRRMYKAYVLRRTDKSDILSGLVLVGFAILPWIFRWAFFSDWPALRIGLSAAAAGSGLAFLYAGIKDRDEPRRIKGLPATFDE